MGTVKVLFLKAEMLEEQTSLRADVQSSKSPPLTIAALIERAGSDGVVALRMMSTGGRATLSCLPD
jgi:hypothetical protein